MNNVWATELLKGLVKNSTAAVIPSTHRALTWVKNLSPAVLTGKKMLWTAHLSQTLGAIQMGGSQILHSADNILPYLNEVTINAQNISFLVWLDLNTHCRYTVQLVVMTLNLRD